MNIRELYQVSRRLVRAGKGNCPVLFDTEAQTYHYHMANVDAAHFEEEPKPHLALSESKPHHTCTCLACEKDE